jgi:hypothetical protein
MKQQKEPLPSGSDAFDAVLRIIRRGGEELEKRRAEEARAGLAEEARRTDDGPQRADRTQQKESVL